jgi:3-phenylpropionate/trans-cinnamate dioxygenase ferredoxin subunit
LDGKRRYIVARAGEILPGARRIVELDGRSIGVFNVHGRYVAVLNLCPHELAPVCLGRLGGTTLASKPGEWVWGREGEILACPWHGWEFDLLTGACLTDRRRLRMYEVIVEDDQIVVIL